jgi:hypothetical protein
MNILCKLFGHKFKLPKGAESKKKFGVWEKLGRPLSLAFDGECNCVRCGQSAFGKDPYGPHGGKERFFEVNKDVPGLNTDALKQPAASKMKATKGK